MRRIPAVALFVSTALAVGGSGVAEAATPSSASVTSSVATADPATQTALDSMAKDFQVMDSALIEDQSGNVIGINVAQLRATYGDSETVNELERLYNKPANSVTPVKTGHLMAATAFASRSFTGCLQSEIAKVFGLDIIKQAWSGEVRAALKSHAWKKASSIIFRNLERRVGKKAASLIIKKLAAKALPGGLPAQLAIAVGKCGIESIWPW